MGNIPGQLIYSAHGCKINGFNELPEWLQAEINERVPLYKDAATQKIDAENITSWKYFKQHFDDYIAGARFPVPTS